MSIKILGAPSDPHQPIATEGLVPLAYEVLGVQIHLDEPKGDILPLVLLL